MRHGTVQPILLTMALFLETQWRQILLALATRITIWVLAPVDFPAFPVPFSDCDWAWVACRSLLRKRREDLRQAICMRLPMLGLLRCQDWELVGASKCRRGLYRR